MFSVHIAAGRGIQAGDATDQYGMISETLRQFAPLSDISQGSNTLEVWWDLHV